MIKIKKYLDMEDLFGCGADLKRQEVENKFYQTEQKEIKENKAKLLKKMKIEE